jgi:hypothetical protein
MEAERISAAQVELHGRVVAQVKAGEVQLGQALRASGLVEGNRWLVDFTDGAFGSSGVSMLPEQPPVGFSVFCPANMGPGGGPEGCPNNATFATVVAAYAAAVSHHLDTGHGGIQVGALFDAVLLTVGEEV